MNEDRKNRNTLWPGQNNLGNGVRAEPLEANSRERRGETKLEFPNAQPDLDALRSVTREWLVPLLVEKFLRDQGIASRVLPGNANFQFIGEEALGFAPRGATGDAPCGARQECPTPECQQTRKTTTER